MSKKTFLVPVVYEMCGHVAVEADSAKDAVAKAILAIDEFPFPEDAEYIDGTFAIDKDGIVYDENGNIVEYQV